ncbi:MAG: hypothetical protein IKI01_06870 [Lachnospiraceae bacterium]|nr:hypothetical protein [Lachnospiraceae bacterium]
MFKDRIIFWKYRKRLQKLKQDSKKAYQLFETALDVSQCGTCYNMDNGNVRNYAERLSKCKECPKSEALLKLAVAADEAETKEEKYTEDEYAHAVYDYYAKRKPELICVNTGESVKWDEVFSLTFADIAKSKRFALVGLIEKEGRYRIK